MSRKKFISLFQQADHIAAEECYSKENYNSDEEDEEEEEEKEAAAPPAAP